MNSKCRKCEAALLCLSGLFRTRGMRCEHCGQVALYLSKNTVWHVHCVTVTYARVVSRCGQCSGFPRVAANRIVVEGETGEENAMP